MFERILDLNINFRIFLQPQNVLNGKRGVVAWFGLLHAILVIIFVTSLVQYGRLSSVANQ